MNMIRKLLLAIVLSCGLAPAFAQAPPPVPALPDSERRTSYSITSSTCACAVNFQLYGDSTDYANWLEVFINGQMISQSGNWTITSPTGPLATIPRPITDAVLTFTAAQTGTVQIVGARRPRRTSQFTENQGVSARNLNQVFTDIIAQNREIWDKTNDFTGRALLARPGETLALLPVLASRMNQGACFNSSGNLTVCTSIPSGTISAGSGIQFTGTNPTSISANLSAGSGIALAGTNPIIISSLPPTYTAPGTGGASQSLTTRLSRTLYLTDYGAACDGVTDDHTALQNMINEAQTLGSRTTAVINCTTLNVASALVITAPFTLKGTGMTSALLLCAPAITCIDKQMGVNTTGMYIGNFSIQYTSTASAGTAAIRQRSTAGHQVIYDQFENMYVFFAFNGFDIDQANSYRMNNVEFNTLGNNGMNLANSSFVDAGNGIINSIQCVSVQACIQWVSGGGVHINNLVVSGVAVNALVIALASGASTSDIWVNNSQLEGISGAAILVTRQGTTGTLKKIRVSNTEFEAHIAVQVPTDATGSWLSDASFTNNQWLGNGVAGDAFYVIDSTANFTISGGTASSSFANSILVQTGAAASNGYVGNIVRSGSFTAMAFAQADSVTLDWSLPGITLAAVPTGARNGSRIFIQDGATGTAPCTGSSTGALAHKQAGAWKCF